MFFIFWRGQGLLALLSLVVSFWLNILLQEVFHTPNFGFWSAVASICSTLVWFVPLWFYGNKINLLQSTGFIDKETGTEVFTENLHTLYWIPLQYWAILGPAAVLLFTIPDLLK